MIFDCGLAPGSPAEAGTGETLEKWRDSAQSLEREVERLRKELQQEKRNSEML